MKLPIHEAKLRLSELVEVVQGGGRIIISEDGGPVAELVRYRHRGGINFEKLEATRKRLGISGNREGWPQAFDDPKFSRQVLGLEESS